MKHEIIDTAVPEKQTQVSWPFPSFPSVHPIFGKAVQIIDQDEKSVNSPETSEIKVENAERTKEVHKPSNLFDNKENYLAFKKQWSKLAEQKALDSRMVMFYNVARGMDYWRGFTPITNKVKLENGQKPDRAITFALDSLDYIMMPKDKLSNEARDKFIALFEGTVDDEFMTKVFNYMK
jgi:hypothetical protein